MSMTHWLGRRRQNRDLSSRRNRSVFLATPITKKSIPRSAKKVRKPHVFRREAPLFNGPTYADARNTSSREAGKLAGGGRDSAAPPPDRQGGSGGGVHGFQSGHWGGAAAWMPWGCPTVCYVPCYMRYRRGKKTREGGNLSVIGLADSAPACPHGRLACRQRCLHGEKNTVRRLNSECRDCIIA